MWKKLMKKYEVLAVEALPPYLRATIIIDLCTQDMLELNTQ